jgi:hypothetical protein
MLYCTCSQILQPFVHQSTSNINSTSSSIPAFAPRDPLPKGALIPSPSIRTYPSLPLDTSEASPHSAPTSPVSSVSLQTLPDAHGTGFVKVVSADSSSAGPRSVHTLPCPSIPQRPPPTPRRPPHAISFTTNAARCARNRIRQGCIGRFELSWPSIHTYPSSPLDTSEASPHSASTSPRHRFHCKCCPMCTEPDSSRLYRQIRAQLALDPYIPFLAPRYPRGFPPLRVDLPASSVSPQMLPDAHGPGFVRVVLADLNTTQILLPMRKHPHEDFDMLHVMSLSLLSIHEKSIIQMVQDQQLHLKRVFEMFFEE